MKKLFKVSSLFVLTTLTPFIASCATAAQRNQNQKLGEYRVRTSFENTIDSHLNEIVSTYLLNDKNQINSFYTQQRQIEKDLINEANYALLFAPLWDVNVYENSGDKVKRTNLAIKKIKNILNNEWFWFLNNIEKQSFAFNPYGNYYESDLNNDLGNLTEIVEEKLANETLLIKIQSKEIKNVYTKELPIRKYDSYTNKKILFLEFDSGKLVPLLSYVHDDVQKFIVLPDILWFSATDNLDTLLDRFINIFYQKKDEYDQKVMDYYKDLDDSSFNAEEYLQKYNDLNTFTFYSLGNYSELFRRTILDLNKETPNLITRFTWGYVNEK